MIDTRRILIAATLILLVVMIAGLWNEDVATSATTEPISISDAALSPSNNTVAAAPAVASNVLIADVSGPPVEPGVVREGRDDRASSLPETMPLFIDDSLHPLSIDWLTARTYPGSDFVIEQILDSGVNYHRMVVSYLSDGFTINALMTIPQTPRPPTGYPVIIFNHGYIPPDQYRTTERYIAYVDAFARNGYIVIKSDYRGHGFSEGPSTSVYGNPGYVVDVLNALSSARRIPEADPDRIGMWGHSMGGYITIRAMVADQNIRAASIWAGVVVSYDEMFASWFNPGVTTRRTWRSQLVEEFGTPDDNPIFWESLSANAYLDNLSGPVQLHHGTADSSVPAIYSTILDQEIRAAGGTSEVYLYTNDDHNISTNLNMALARSIAFFDAHVKNA